MERTAKVLIKVADAHDGLRLYCSHTNMSGEFLSPGLHVCTEILKVQFVLFLSFSKPKAIVSVSVTL